MRPIDAHVAWFCGCLSVGQEPSVSSAKTDEPIAMLLPARRNASTGTSYGPVSVCLSVCLSQVGVLSKRMNELSSWFLTRELSLTYPTLCCKEIQVPSIQGFIPSGTLPQTLRLRKFRDSISIVEAYYRLSSRKRDAQSVTNLAVVGQLSR